MRCLTASLALIALVGCDNGPVVDQNESPVAVMNDDVSQPANVRVFLDGRSSFDADGDNLEFHWTLDHAPEESQLDDQVGPLSPNHSTEAATTSFQPDVPGVYIVALRVYDGQQYSDPSYLIVTAEEPTECPVANAGNDQTLAFGETASLDGGQSVDPQGGVLDFSWTLVAKPYNSRLTVDSVTNADQKQAEFAADVAGEYGLGLVVDNGMCQSPPDRAEIAFEGDNNPPEANASGDFSAEDCQLTQLNCSASTDADNDRLFYWWTVQASPENSFVDNRSFTNQNDAEAQIFFDVDGEYQLACSVFDGQAWSRPDTITVTVDDRSYNTPPVVDVGPDIEVDYGIVECKQERVPYTWSPLTTSCDKAEAEEDIILEAKVTDPDGDDFFLEWEVIRDSRARIVGRVDTLRVDIEPPSFQPTELGRTEDISYIQLTATDCTFEEGSDEFELYTFVEGEL